MAETRLLMKRGCGYPKPGGVYLESMGEAGGTLPIIVVLDPPIEHTHFHRGCDNKYRHLMTSKPGGGMSLVFRSQTDTFLMS